MANVFNYIKEYGNKSFFDEPFNEVDASIFSLLAYIDFYNIVPSNNKKVKLSNSLEYFLTYGNINDFLKKGFVQKELIKLCQLLKDKERYRDILIYGYEYIVNFDEQFCAVSFKLPDGKLIISFEGTDHNLSGWEEDMTLCYKFPVPSHKDAIRYLKKHITFFDREVYLVGHSKGGHLALVAGMFSDIINNFKIKKIYNFDGPGLRKREFESNNYKRISKKLYHIIPNYSFFGILLRHNDNYISVKSSKMGIMAHSIFNWVINGYNFKREPLSLISKNMDKSIILWLNEHSDSEREKITKGIFDYFRKAGIDNFTEITKLKNIISLIKCSSELDKYTKNMIINFVRFIIEYHINNRDEIELV